MDGSPREMCFISRLQATVWFGQCLWALLTFPETQQGGGGSCSDTMSVYLEGCWSLTLNPRRRRQCRSEPSVSRVSVTGDWQSGSGREILCFRGTCSWQIILFFLFWMSFKAV